MSSAQRVKVTFTRLPALMVRNRMIVIASFGPVPAPREPAPRGPDLHYMPQRGRRPVRGGLPPVRAGPRLNCGDRHRRQPGPVGARRARAGPGAAVGHGPAVAVDEGDAPAGASPGGGEGCGEVAAGAGVPRAVRPGLARRVRAALPR